MAVIVRKQVEIGGSAVELKSYLPAGGLSKEDRLRADRLDRVLAEKMPSMVRRLADSAPEPQGMVRRYYLLGKMLREVLDDRDLVLQADIESGVVFLAIWDHLPGELRPELPAAGKSLAEKRHKRRDLLSLCYEISALDWDEVAWLREWDNWRQLARRPGLFRDRRVLRTLGEAIGRFRVYPSNSGFRTILRTLGNSFPTRPYRDSSFLSNEAVNSAVLDAVARASATGTG
jgi:hypothetical protein